MQPESISTDTRLTQRSNSARRRGRPRGSRMAGKKISSSNLRWYSRMTEICSSSREPKWANTPDLLMRVTSASAPMLKPSSPMLDARPSAASRMAARVCWPFCSSGRAGRREGSGVSKSGTGRK
jgi:hypothetical protein